MRSWKILIGMLMVVMMALSACGAGGGNIVKIAILAPLSGDVATFGQSTRDGAMRSSRPLGSSSVSASPVKSLIVPVRRDSSGPPPRVTMTRSSDRATGLRTRINRPGRFRQARVERGE